MADPADVNVDELRRRARRRLVGAIVLALAAAVFVPMLLESDPKPLGEDVSVRIPPVDDGKFVNRLNERARPRRPSRPPKSEARAETKPEPPKTRGAIEERSRNRRRRSRDRSREPEPPKPALGDKSDSSADREIARRSRAARSSRPRRTGTSARTSEAASTAATSPPAARRGRLPAPHPPLLPSLRRRRTASPPSDGFRRPAGGVLRRLRRERTVQQTQEGRLSRLYRATGHEQGDDTVARARRPVSVARCRGRRRVTS